MPTRRGLLRAGAAVALGSLSVACGRRGSGPPSSASALGAPAAVPSAYGVGPSRFAELTLPSGTGPFAVVVVIHGGFWRAEYDLSLGRPLAADLAGRGYAAWNIEYRRIGAGAGGGGGWPATFDDVAAAVDALAGLAAAGSPLDLDRVITLGHSAGGHLAVWAAGRPALSAGTPGAGPVVSLRGAISQAGVLDLDRAVAEDLGGGATRALLGGDPGGFPDRYAAASPQRQLPLPVPVVCVHGRADTIVPLSQSERYVDAASASGAQARLAAVDGDHFAVIDVASPAWTAVVEAVGELT